MKKTVFVLLIGNYLPRLCSLTLPSIERYARRIGAGFRLISERRYPEWPVTYEKVQVFDLGRDNDWNLFVDADTVLGDRLEDVTEVVPKTHVGVQLSYPFNAMYPPNIYSLRDGRNIGLSGNFVASHSLTHDVWTPFGESVDEVVARATVNGTMATKVEKASHYMVMDEYCLSCNLARFGLKFTGVTNSKDAILHLHANATTEEACVAKAAEYAERENAISRYAKIR